MESFSRIVEDISAPIGPLLAHADLGMLLGLASVVLIVLFGRRTAKKLSEIDFALAEMRAIGASTNRLEALQELREILTVSTAATRLLEKLETDIEAVGEIRDVNLAVAQRVGEVLQELREMQHDLQAASRETPAGRFFQSRAPDEASETIDRMQREIDALKTRAPPARDDDDDDDPARRHAREALAAFVRDGSDL